RASVIGVGVCAVAAVVVAGMFHVARPARAATSIAGLHVVGNQIVNSSGQAIRPLGFDRAGTEYMCDAAGDTTVFDGPSDAASVSAMLSWHINAVRLPVNEDCWLGINGYPAAQYTAAQYQQAIVTFVNLLNSSGILAIVDLHWNAPGGQQSNAQQAMPDLDHA